MSEVLGSTFKKPSCGNVPPGLLRDVLGGLINLQVVGTDPDVEGPVIAPLSNDFEPNLNPDGTFFIIPETDAAVYVVELADGSQFTITAVQSTANLGLVMPFRIRKVLAAGTTGNFSVVY